MKNLANKHSPIRLEKKKCDFEDEKIGKIDDSGLTMLG